jgi:hypothetical protein
MTVSVVINPTYPVPGRPARVAFHTSSGNFVRAFVTNAPLSSAYREQLDESGASKLQVYQGDSGAVWAFTPDVGGVYTLAVDEVTRGASSYGGGWHRSDASHQTETPIGTTTITLSVGQRLTAPVGAGSDTATLVLWVWGSTIRETTYDVHGEASPALVSAQSDLMRNAIANAGVLSQLQALIGVVASTALGDPFAAMLQVLLEISDHMASSTHHEVSDSENVVPATMIVSPGDCSQFVRQVADIAQRLTRHMRNDANTGGGPGSAGYHSLADLTNTPFVTQATDVASAIVAFADIYRAYEAHRVNTAAHTSADVTQVLPTLSPLLELHRRIVALLPPKSPASSSTENAGVQVLVSGAGMEQS